MSTSPNNYISSFVSLYVMGYSFLKLETPRLGWVVNYWKKSFCSDPTIKQQHRGAFSMSIKRDHDGVLNHDHDSKNGINGHILMDGIQEPPFKKLKIAIETLPERKVEFYGDDGGENYEE